MWVYEASHNVCRNVKTSFRGQNLARINVRPATESSPFSVDVRLQKPPHAIPSSSVILPHEELKIKLIRARQEKAARARLGISSAKLPPSNGTGLASHHDLTSYLRAHQARLNACRDDQDKLDALNTNYVHLGTRYEYLIQQHLARNLGFSLTQVGGRGDGGVDLIGTWTLPKTTDQKPSGPAVTFKIFVQAKRFAPHRKVMPSLMREVEGTLNSAPDSKLLKEAFADHLVRVGRTGVFTSEKHSNSDGEVQGGSTPTTIEDLGVLITTRPISDGIEKAMSNSRRCLVYIHLEEYPFQVPQKRTKAALGLVNQFESDEAIRTTSPEGSFGNASAQSSKGVPLTKIRQIVWNEAASKAGLVGYNVAITHSSQTSSDEYGQGEAMLAYGGDLVHV